MLPMQITIKKTRRNRHVTFNRNLTNANCTAEYTWLRHGSDEANRLSLDATDRLRIIKYRVANFFVAAQRISLIYIFIKYNK